jgi:hypothetical protein
MQHHLSPRAGSSVATVVLFCGSLCAIVLAVFAHAFIFHTH